MSKRKPIQPPDEWHGGGIDRRNHPEKVKQLQAQLAAEREASKKAYTEGWRVGRDFAVEGQRDTAANPPQAEPLALEKQLAASKDEVIVAMRERNDLIKQLAAERHRREACEVLIRDLQKQLAAMSL